MRFSLDVQQLPCHLKGHEPLSEEQRPDTEGQPSQRQEATLDCVAPLSHRSLTLPDWQSTWSEGSVWRCAQRKARVARRNARTASALYKNVGVGTRKSKFGLGGERGRHVAVGNGREGGPILSHHTLKRKDIEKQLPALAESQSVVTAFPPRCIFSDDDILSLDAPR